VSMPAPSLERPVAQQPAEVRSQFMTRVYVRLLAGIAAFIVVEFALFTLPSPDASFAAMITSLVASTNWLLILGGFMLVSWLASRLSYRATTPAAAFGGYALLVVANALLFATPLYIAANTPALEGTIETAAQISLLAFAVLSVIAIRTSKDFSFLRPFLLWIGLLALGAIVASVLFGFTLGVWFPVAMIAFAGAAILYDTQKIYHSYPPHMETQAAMNLFSSIALLFWYVLQLLMRR
jgi:uncharacterized protein